MFHSTADQNLLFGLIALQMDFINRDQLIEGMTAWAVDKPQALGSILVEKGHLSSDRKSLLDALVVEHLKQHRGDAGQSLAALSSVETSVQHELQGLSDSDVTASLQHLLPSATSLGDPEGTGIVSLGFSSSSGSRFRILRPHAKGGLGQVSVAYDGELDREVALKEIQPQHAGCAESRRRFILEAEVTGSLEHPGIVPVYGMGTYADGRPFYAMRFIQGDSLKQAIQRFHLHRREDGRTNVERDPELANLLNRFLDVCDAMAYAHSRGVLHRDLKPGNIMLGQFGETLVVDWGLAKRLNHNDPEPQDALGSPLLSASRHAETLPGSAVGTPQYMSPEQAKGETDKLGLLTDVYSLGAILFEIITGRAPHPGKDAMDCLMAAARNQIVPTDQTGELLDIAYRAMATKPEDRYQQITDLSSAIREYLTHRESISLAMMAEADLEHARKTGKYDDYAKARFRFEEALKLWKHNHRATSGLKAAQIAFELEQENYDAALSFLNSNDPKDDNLRADILNAKAEREGRIRRLEAAKRAGRAMLAALFLVVSGAAFLINNARIVADNERQNAVEAKVVADNERQNAVEARNDAVLAQKAAEETPKTGSQLEKTGRRCARQ